ncbi:bis(5'-nucleosyl)-tetraphosphatase [Scatolibacter rhodanostii]|uniref:bis(5'-nucleosyl)-tetraphosphatase n=1 Tax=Scatolibacter rhodanostii TaxID=2014781 RepID=UPI000C081E56|nr:NUDIX domain-containing protein [Scatolibacter rhodanostii]
MKKEKSCGAIIYRKKQEIVEILLICHKKGGHWSFPKGHVEADETEIETAKREVLEETGLHIAVEDQFRTTIGYTLPGDVWKDVVYFAAQVVSGKEKIQEEEVTALGWFPLEEALSRITHENSRKILRKFMDYLG